MSARFHGFGGSRERDDYLLVMAFPRGDGTDELDERGLPRPPPRRLWCCLRTDGSICPECISHPGQREG